MICWVLVSCSKLKTSNQQSFVNVNVLVGAMLDVLGHESIYVLIGKGH